MKITKKKLFFYIIKKGDFLKKNVKIITVSQMFSIVFMRFSLSFLRDE